MKKFNYLIFIFLFFISCSEESLNDDKNLNDFTKDEGVFIDERDGQEYKWVKIGEQIWMAENLAYLPEISTNAYNAPCYYVYDYKGSSINEAKNTNNYKTYGVLYNWNAAKISCPTGWHLPSVEEWNQLARYIANSKGYPERGADHWENVGKHLREKGTIEDGDGLWLKYYNSDPNHENNKYIVSGTNEYGFSAIPGGSAANYGGEMSYVEQSSSSYFWTSSSAGSDHGYPVSLRLSGNMWLGGPYILGKDRGMSVRCVKD